MLKLWYAGAAVASGILLFAASPARADEQPTPPQLLPGNSVAPPFGDFLSGAGGYALNSVRMAGGGALSGTDDAARQARNGLDRVRRPTNNLHMTVPLDGSRPLTRIRPGTNSPALLPKSGRHLPPASVIGPLEPQTSLDDGDGLLGIPLLTGLLPSGRPQSPDFGETESLPLLSGLLPDPTTPDVTDVSGLPAGGMAVLPPAVRPHTRGKPAATPAATPAAVAPTATATAATPAAPTASDAPVPSGAPVDPRLHEEPIDPSERTFSPAGRPIAGVDQQYK